MKKCLFLILLLSACTSFLLKEKVYVKTKVAFVPKPFPIMMFGADNTQSIENYKIQEAFKYYFSLYGFDTEPKKFKDFKWIFFYEFQYNNCFVGKLKPILSSYTDKTLFSEMQDVVEIRICSNISRETLSNIMFNILYRTSLVKEENKILRF